MLPGAAFQDRRNGSDRDAKRARQNHRLVAVRVTVSDGDHGFSRQLMTSVALSAVVCSVLSFIEKVVAANIPAEIARSIVGGVAVVMAGFVADWCRANEGFQYQAMQVAVLSTPFVSKVNLQITKWRRGGWFQFTPCRADACSSADRSATVDAPFFVDCVPWPIRNLSKLGNVHLTIVTP